MQLGEIQMEIEDESPFPTFVAGQIEVVDLELPFSTEQLEQILMKGTENCDFEELLTKENTSQIMVFQPITEDLSNKKYKCSQDWPSVDKKGKVCVRENMKLEMRILNSHHYACIFGDIIIHTDFTSLNDYLGTSSPLNKVKKIERVTVFHQSKLIEAFFQPADNTFVEFDGIIEMFRNYPEQQMHALGESLSRYKDYSMRQQKMIQICSLQPGFDTFELLKKQKFARFKVSCMKIVSELSSNKCISYLFYKRNFRTGGLELHSMGLNEKLVEMLGSTVSDFNDLIRRVGIYTFQNKNIYNFIMQKYLEHMGQRLRNPSQNSKQGGIVKVFELRYSSQILTIDDFLVNSENSLQSFVDFTDEDNDITTDILKFRDMCHIFVVDVIDREKQELLNARQQKLSFSASVKQKELIEQHSLYYELESSVFLDKFYHRTISPKSTDSVKGTIPKQTCGYRDLIP